MPKFTRISALLRRKMRKNQLANFQNLAKDERLALQTLKQKLITLPSVIPW